MAARTPATRRSGRPRTAARCRPFIERLPEGLDTMVGDRGVKLSGGQRQRIAIARAFLKNAPLLIFDEATSALDGESEEAIRAAMERLMAGRTVIDDRPSLRPLRNFDRILVLHAGRLMEDGAPDQLLRAQRALSEIRQSGDRPADRRTPPEISSPIRVTPMEMDAKAEQSEAFITELHSEDHALFFIPASTSLHELRPRTLKHGDIFGLFDHNGDAREARSPEGRLSSTIRATCPASVS